MPIYRNIHVAAHTRESRKDRGTYARRSRLLRSTVSCSNWLPLYPPLSPVRGMEWGYGRTPRSADAARRHALRNELLDCECLLIGSLTRHIQSPNQLRVARRLAG